MRKDHELVDSEYVASSEAALILQRTPDTVRLMARRGRLRTAIATRAGRLYRRADVEKLAKELNEQNEGRARAKAGL
jgi:hypothetical protein